MVTIQKVISREVFWHVFAKIPRHTRKNAITEGDLECILTRNCEGTEQLPFMIGNQQRIKTVQTDIYKKHISCIAFCFYSATLTN